MFPILHGLMSGISGGITFLFRDDFTTDEAAPPTSPRTAEPGPGPLTVTDTNSVISISGGKIHVNGTVGGNDGLLSEQFSRQDGRVFVFAVEDRTTITANARMGLANGNLGSPGVDLGFDWPSATAIRIKAGVGIIGTVTVGSATLFAAIMFASGGLLAYHNGTNWIALWIYATPSTAQYAKMWIGASALNFKTDNWRVSDSAALTQSAIATDRHAGNVTAGTTFTHEADCLIEFTANLGSTSTQIDFRKQDDSNKWVLELTNSGGLHLIEQVGSKSYRASAWGKLAGGERIVIICANETITCYYDNMQAWSYSSATNFKTETTGALKNLGIGGAVSDLITWPSTLSGAATAALDAVANA